MQPSQRALENSLHINALELLTLTVALKVWGSRLRGKRIVVFCDNMASVQVLNSGASRDKFSQACLREVCWHAAKHQFEVRGRHLPGVSNRLPDLLSRWSLGDRPQQKFRSLTIDMDLQECHVSEDSFVFTHEW